MKGCLQGIDREDLEVLWRIVKAKYGDQRPEYEFERVLWGDLKVMFEPDKRSDVWRILQGYRAENYYCQANVNAVEMTWAPKLQLHIKRGRDTKIPQSSGPPDKGSGPRCQDTILGDVDAQTRFEITSKQSIDLPLSRGYTLGSGEDSMKLLELMEFCTQLLKLVMPLFVYAVKHMLMMSVQVSAAEGAFFAEMHNVVAFLEKLKESDGFAEIIDFLKASSVHYALTVNPIIYTSCIVQFWATTKVQTVNEVRQLQALVDKKRVIVTKSSIRRDLHLDDAEGTDCLPTATIFEALARIGRITPLFDTMMVQAYEEVGEDSYHPTDSTQIPIIDQPSSSSQPKKKQPSKKAQRQEAEKKLKSGGKIRGRKQRLLKMRLHRRKKQVLDLEKAKSDQAIEIACLKKKGPDLDADDEVTLVNETQERQDEELMFDTGVLDGDEMFVDDTKIEKEE
ncbi:hypothetical protein Tco_0524065 [Tanacetum coccineum]